MQVVKSDKRAIQGGNIYNGASWSSNMGTIVYEVLCHGKTNKIVPSLYILIRGITGDLQGRGNFFAPLEVI